MHEQQSNSLFSLLYTFLDTSMLYILHKGVVSRTCFGCPRLCTMCDSSVPSLGSLLDRCYQTTLMTYYVSFRERKSQKLLGNGSCGPSLDMYLLYGQFLPSLDVLVSSQHPSMLHKALLYPYGRYTHHLEDLRSGSRLVSESIEIHLIPDNYS